MSLTTKWSFGTGPVSPVASWYAWFGLLAGEEVREVELDRRGVDVDGAHVSEVTAVLQGGSRERRGLCGADGTVSDDVAGRVEPAEVDLALRRDDQRERVQVGIDRVRHVEDVGGHG